MKESNVLTWLSMLLGNVPLVPEFGAIVATLTIMDA